MGAMLYIILCYFISISVVGLDEVVGIYEVSIGGVNGEREKQPPFRDCDRIRRARWNCGISTQFNTKALTSGALQPSSSAGPSTRINPAWRRS